jgi:hypothetical protein
MSDEAETRRPDAADRGMPLPSMVAQLVARNHIEKLSAVGNSVITEGLVPYRCMCCVCSV